MTRVILLIACVFALINTSAAQPFINFDSKSDAYWRALESQIKRTLDENVDGVATQQLRNVIVFRSLYADRVDLADAVPAIIRIHRKPSDQETRDLAVAALNAINSFEARSYVRNRVSSSEMIAARVATRDALSRALDQLVFAEVTEPAN